MPKQTLISGIQPTGKLHIGNYFGALKNFVALQNSKKYECYFFVADLHSLTENYDVKEKYNQIIDVVLNYLAAGIDPKNSIIFIQSQILEHSELAWILNTVTPFGELSRMTQFKEKSDIQKENINVGLFNYPVLQAADILLYDAKFVPVGQDQIQHLEFTRTLARKFNLKYRNLFAEPKEVLTETPRLMSLNNPTKKMSKSVLDGCLFLDDTPKEIQQKIKAAVTDSGAEIKYDPKEKPAISNLLKIYANFSNLPIKKIEKKYFNKGYGDFKKDLAEIIITELTPFQKKKSDFSKKIKFIEEIIEDGKIKAQKKAFQKMRNIKKAIGLLK